jgi:hypothetical protein
MTTLPFTDLETAYETLARAIDTAGRENESLFLAKLALVLAHQSGDIAMFKQAVATALEDIAEGRAAAES